MRFSSPGVVPGSFPRGLTLPTRGLKYGFQGTIIAKNLRKNCFSPYDGGYYVPTGGHSPPGAAPVAAYDEMSTVPIRFNTYAFELRIMLAKVSHHKNRTQVVSKLMPSRLHVCMADYNRKDRLHLLCRLINSK